MMRRGSLSGRFSGALALLVIAFVACLGSPEVQEAKPAPQPASGGVPWPAPSDPLDRIVAAGFEPITHEFLNYHVHAHLDVFVNGEPVEVPAGIGINIADPAVHTTQSALGPTYGASILLAPSPASRRYTHMTPTASCTPRPQKSIPTRSASSSSSGAWLSRPSASAATAHPMRRSRYSWTGRPTLAIPPTSSSPTCEK